MQHQHQQQQQQRQHATQAKAFVEHFNALAADALRASAPATAPVNGLVYRRVRTWPTPESVGWMGEIGPRTRGVANGWLDSSLDLRDGLSVVEVFAEQVIADEAMAVALH